MSANQIISVSFFKYEGRANRWWGFRQMGLAPTELQEVPGLQFCKMLGSGAGNGFSIWPNFGVYGLLCVWENDSYLNAFFAENPLLKEFQEKASNAWTSILKTAHSHGRWDGQVPFEANVPYDKNKPVAVITRATIHPKKLWQFWRYVPSVSRSMSKHREGLLFSVGIGELPLVQQATFSLWENSHLMMDFAYKSRLHSKVVQRTREIGWYKEELFARFHPIASFGSWEGKQPLANLLPQNSDTY